MSSSLGWMIGGGPWFPTGLEFMPAADPGVDFYGGGVGGRIYVHTSPVNTAMDAAGTDDVKRYGYEWLANPDQRLSPSDTLVLRTSYPSPRPEKGIPHPDARTVSPSLPRSVTDWWVYSISPLSTSTTTSAGA